MDDLPPGQEATLWLYGVARNVLANHHRSEARRKARSAELDLKMADRYAESPDSRLDQEAIARIFRALPDDDRELLGLVAWEGLDHKEIATALGLSRNVVRVRLHRARRRFSRALAHKGHPFNAGKPVRAGGEAAVKNTDELDAMTRALARVAYGQPGGHPADPEARTLLTLITAEAEPGRLPPGATGSRSAPRFRLPRMSGAS
ncbi:RNA polymerase sigma factor [Nonomuraea aurantiaca]|uniref:RNA polymerase sigma factor n=1 Tax=Nonomuraea aurantiaca TaxID=2878562 RepID=UPI0021E66F47|nr:sigma-70 family RNA polymerase sigma factor [Nonomuraea aurantiaca]